MKAVRCWVAFTLALLAASSASAQVAATLPPSRPAPRDVRLGAADTLHGVVLNSSGAPQSGVEVVLQCAGASPLRTVTNGQGQFAIASAPSGLGALHVQGSSCTVRIWGPALAPPAARNALLIVPADSTRLGQSNAAPLFSNLGAWVGGAALLGAAAAMPLLDNDAS